MPAFFEDYEEFRGDGSRNEKGETLDEFLQKYDPYKYKNPCSTVDMVVFGYSGNMPDTMSKLKVLLIRRRNHPSIGDWAMPGGFINLYEDLEISARRELFEETHIKDIQIEQIGAFGNVRRDPRARVITTAFMALVCMDEVEAKAGDDAKDAKWFEVHVNKKMREGDFLYDMRITNKEYNIILQPQVSVQMSGRLIRTQKMKVMKRDKMASDHAAILLQAYLKLKERMEYQNKEKSRDEME